MPVGVNAYIPLANVTLGSSASSVTFSNIPATYRDLVCVVNHTKSTLATFTIRFNGDNTSGNYTSVYIVGDGAGFTSATETGFTFAFSDTTRSTQICQVMDYSATDKHKTMLLRHSDSARQSTAYAARWANTAAITSMAFAPSSGTFATGSTFNLFGISA
jgi:hypothetical protein